MRIALAAALITAAAVTACGNRSPRVSGCNKPQPAGFPTTDVGPQIGQTPPDFKLLDLDGNEVCLRDYTGKVVLVSVGAGWCEPCRQEMPAIVSQYAALSSQGFVVLMPMLQDNAGLPPDSDFLHAWQAQYGIDFPLMADPDAISYDQMVEPASQGSIPLDVLLNRDQVVIFNQTGGINENTLHTLAQGQLNIPASLDYGP